MELVGRQETMAERAALRLAERSSASHDFPLAALHRAIAASADGAWGDAQRLLAPAVERLRRCDAVAVLAHALARQSHAALHTGDWQICLATARECELLARRVGQPELALAGALIAARAAALVAPREEAELELARTTAAAARARGLSAADALLRAARASIAAADGDSERVYAQLIVLFPADGAVPHPTVRAGGEIFDLVEAAVALRRPAEAARLLHGFERGGAPLRAGSLAAAAIVCARPLVADDAAAEPLFARALAHDLTDWPFLRARTLLARGRRLHRGKRAEEATAVLRIAREELSMLGAVRFLERARRELRAAGDGGAAEHAAGGGLRRLSPHELRIARMAASGMSNAQIADRLGVSSRTIGTHLYRLFPKLGVSARTQLTVALREPPAARDRAAATMPSARLQPSARGPVEHARRLALRELVGLAGYARCWSGEWAAALSGAGAGRALAAAAGDEFSVAAAEATLALCHGLRGDHAAAERAARAALDSPLTRGVRFVRFTAQQGLAFGAMTAGRHDEAYQLLRLCFDAGSPVFHRDMRFWALGDLAELALRAGRADEAHVLLAALAPAARRTRSPRTRLALAHAEALLAAPGDAEPRFRAALALDLGPWPLDRARIQLAYGAWLRRARRASDARAPLRAAQAGFDALGPTAWSERVREELSASGETRRAREPSGGDELTPQELQIATMAARGLTNRQIGQHLLLSPRTVGSHLYRVFPKLAIGSRGELAGALGRFTASASPTRAPCPPSARA